MELVLNDMIIGIVMGVGITSFLVMVYLLVPLFKKSLKGKLK